MVRKTKASATVTSEGNSFGGNTPARATISHIPNTTMKGRRCARSPASARPPGARDDPRREDAGLGGDVGHAGE